MPVAPAVHVDELLAGAARAERAAAHRRSRERRRSGSAAIGRRTCHSPRDRAGRCSCPQRATRRSRRLLEQRGAARRARSLCRRPRGSARARACETAPSRSSRSSWTLAHADGRERRLELGVRGQPAFAPEEAPAAAERRRGDVERASVATDRSSQNVSTVISSGSHATARSLAVRLISERALVSRKTLKRASIGSSRCSASPAGPSDAAAVSGRMTSNWQAIAGRETRIQAAGRPRRLSNRRVSRARRAGSLVARDGLAGETASCEHQMCTPYGGKRYVSRDHI